MPDIASITEIAPWLLYATPIAVVIGALLWQRVRDRRGAAKDRMNDPDEP